MDLPEIYWRGRHNRTTEGGLAPRLQDMYYRRLFKSPANLEVGLKACKLRSSIWTSYCDGGLDGCKVFSKVGKGP